MSFARSFSRSLSLRVRLNAFFCWCPGFSQTVTSSTYSVRTHKKYRYAFDWESKKIWNKRGRNRNRVRKVRNFYHVLTFFSVATNFALITRLPKWMYTVYTQFVLQYIHNTHMNVYWWDAIESLFLQRSFANKNLQLLPQGFPSIFHYICEYCCKRRTFVWILSIDV